MKERLRGRGALALALLGAVSLGCLAPLGADVEVSQAELDGRLGAYGGGGETRVAHADEHYVELRSSGDAGAIMAGLSVDDGLGSLEPGRARRFDGGRGVEVLGCGGPSDGVWVFDRHADDITLRVEQVDPSVRRVFVDAVWDDGSTVQGSFEYALVEEPSDG